MHSCLHKHALPVKLSITAAVLAVVLAFAGSAAAQGGHLENRVVLNPQGRPVGGATIRVCTQAATGVPCTPLASIFSDLALTVAKVNPFQADGNGNYDIYATANAAVTLQISGPGITTTTISNVFVPGPGVTGIAGTGVAGQVAYFTTPTALGVAPYFLPLAASGLASPPTQAPNAGSVATGGTIAGGTYYLKNTFGNKNGETTASPAKTLVVPAGSTNEVLVSTSDNAWLTGSYKMRVYASTDNVNFYLQTPATVSFSIAAVGSSFTVTTAQRTAGVVTLITTAAHNYAAGQGITVTGISDASFNGTFVLIQAFGSTVTYRQYALADVALFSTGGTTTKFAISRAGNLVWVQTAAAQPFVSDQAVTIAGVTDASFNGTFVVQDIPGQNVFTFPQTAADATSSGGTASYSPAVDTNWSYIHLGDTSAHGDHSINIASFVFSGTQPPATNTATIDPLQVLVNAAHNPPNLYNDTQGTLILPYQTFTESTPLVLGRNPPLIQGTSVELDNSAAGSGTIIRLDPAISDRQIGAVMVMDQNVGLRRLTLVASGDTNVIMVVRGSASQNGLFLSGVNLQNLSSSTVAAALRVHWVTQAYNWNFENVSIISPLTGVLVTNSGITDWHWSHGRINCGNVPLSSAMRVRGGPTDVDLGINYPTAGPGINHSEFRDITVEANRGIGLDYQATLGIELENVSFADARLDTGVTCGLKLGQDSFIVNGGALSTYEMALPSVCYTRGAVALTGYDTPISPNASSVSIDLNSTTQVINLVACNGASSCNVANPFQTSFQVVHPGPSFGNAVNAIGMGDFVTAIGRTANFRITGGTVYTSPGSFGNNRIFQWDEGASTQMNWYFGDPGVTANRWRSENLTGTPAGMTSAWYRTDGLTQMFRINDANSADEVRSRRILPMSDLGGFTLGTSGNRWDNIFVQQDTLNLIAPPANPPSGFIALFAKTATGKLACLTSAGADCMPATGSATDVRTAYNVKDHGAVGDGATDDTTAVQNTLNLCNGVTPRSVFLPYATYVVSAITIPSNCEVSGDGPGRTILLRKANTAAAGSAVVTNNATTIGNTNIFLHDLTIDGNRTNQNAGDDFAAALSTIFVSNFKVNRVELKNCGAAFGTTNVGVCWYGFSLTDGEFISNLIDGGWALNSNAGGIQLNAQTSTGSQIATARLRIGLNRIDASANHSAGIKLAASTGTFTSMSDVEVFDNDITVGDATASIVASTGASRSANVVTITATAAHGGRVGASVNIAGVVGCATSPNGTFTIATIPSTTTFTYSQTGPNESCGSGTSAMADTEGIEIIGCTSPACSATDPSGAATKFTFRHNQIRGENTTNTRIFGISVGGASRSIVDGNTVTNARGLALENIGNNNTFSANTVVTSAKSTIDSQGLSAALFGISWVGNQFVGGIDANQDLMVITNSTTNGVNDLKIQDNLFYQPAGRAVLFNCASGSKCNRPHLTGNSFVGLNTASVAAVELTNVVDGNLGGNTFTNWLGAGSACIRVAAGSSKVFSFFDRFNTSSCPANKEFDDIAATFDNTFIARNSANGDIIMRGLTSINVDRYSSDGTQFCFDSFVKNGGTGGAQPIWNFICNGGSAQTYFALDHGATAPTGLIGSVQMKTAMQLVSVTFANLGSAADGSQVYCSNCNRPTVVDNTCASTPGPGAVASRVSGAWKCF